MAVDTTSPLLQLLLQGTGNNNNTWGTNLNESVFLLIEQAIAGITEVPVTGAGDVTLTADESRSATIVLTGILTANQTIIMPATAKRWTIINSTTGAFFVLVKTAAGTAVNAPQGASTDMISDGTTITRKDANKVGELFFHAGTAVPSGALECDGTAYKRAGVVDLYAKIGVTWGNTDGTDFKVPPGKDTGRFVRSRTASVAVGTSQSNQNKSHTHTGSGSTGAISADHTHAFAGSTSSTDVDHTHTFSTPNTPTSVNNGADKQVFAYTGGTSTTSGQSNGHTHTYSGATGGVSSNHTHAYSFTTSTGSADGTEARPEAIVGILCIRY